MKASAVLLIVALASALVACAVADYPDLDNYCQANMNGVPKLNQKDDKTLVQLMVIFRHGDRTPVNAIPGVDVTPWDCTISELDVVDNSPSASADVNRLYSRYYIDGRQPWSGNCTIGWLTAKGMQQHIQLGATLRAHYIDDLKFLSSELNPSEIYLRSTDVPRTFKSLQSQLMGWYPASSRGNQQLPVLPIATITPSTDNMTPNPALCPRLEQVFSILKASNEWQKKMNGTLSLRKTLAKAFNVSIDSLPNFISIADPLVAGYCSKKSFPNGITNDIISQVKKLAEWEMYYLSASQEASILGMGTFLEEMLSWQAKAMSSSTAPKLVMYSGHDSTLQPLMEALQCQDNIWPPYASHMLVELYKDSSSNPYVRLIYNGKEIELDACGGTMCKYADFVKQVSWALPRDYEKQCRPSKAGVMLSESFLAKSRYRAGGAFDAAEMY